MRELTPGWRHVAINVEGAPILLDGLNPWQQQWHRLQDAPITVAHPSYPTQRHDMWVYELRASSKAVKFAVGEFSNGVWGFYVPT